MIEIPLTPKDHKRIDCLQRRADHLAQRVGNTGRTGLSYDREELSALNWAINEITKGRGVE